MSKRTSDYFYWLVSLLGLLLLLYGMGYLAIAHREESISIVAEPTPQGIHTRKVVGCSWKGGRVGVWFGHYVFGPAYRLDSRYIRRHYWSAYSEYLVPGGTNVIYACDQKL